MVEIIMAAQETKEELLYKKRFIELANTAYFKEYAVFTDFLNLNEQSVFLETVRELPKINFFMWGGAKHTERKMICFSCEKIDTENFPLSVIKVSPIQVKFAENLSHRDYLGALMNLGIERCKIGDIWLHEKNAYVFVDSTLKEYISQELTKVRHTSVRCVDVEEDFSYEQQYEELVGTVSSIRLDTLITMAFQGSRSNLIQHIAARKVFVNSKLTTSNGYSINPGDIISVRGMGKFIFQEELGVSKKGKIKVILRKYM